MSSITRLRESYNPAFNPHRFIGVGLSLLCTSAASAVTVDDYARAERFLPWNASRYITNGDIQHHWIGTEDRFWYLRTNATGDKEFVVVDAASGKRTPAFDQQRIAAALSRQTGKRVAAGQLPFSSFRYVEHQTAMQFQIADTLWTCQLKPAACVAASPKAAANEAVSPDGQWAAFLKDHNLWLRPIAGGDAFPLTTDGREHYGYAGSPGYSTHAVTDLRHRKPTPPQILWSPDSRFLLTHRLDERQVQDFFLLQSVPDDGSIRPKLYPYRFAIPGDAHLPMLEPIVFEVAARRQLNLKTPPLISLWKTWIEMHDTWWSADSRSVYYLHWDRFSKAISLQRADSRTGVVREVLRETTGVNRVQRWGRGGPAVRVLRNGDVIWHSERAGWGHLYYHDGATGALRHPITQGEWVVRSIVRIDEAKQRIYFLASGRERGRDPYEEYLYSIQFDGSRLRLLTPEAANHTVAGPTVLSTEGEQDGFSTSGRYFVDRYSRPDRPPVLALRAADGRLIQQLEVADISKLRAAGYTPVEPFQVLAADGKTPIYGNLYRPSNFDPTRKYPVIDEIYPGPPTARTAKHFAAATFDYNGAESLAELGFIVITIDGRGTAYRSRAFLDHSYGRMNKASDLEDHIAGLRQLAERYPYLDLERVGIDGISGGGYAAAYAVMAYPDFYKVAVSAAGNHDQRGGYAFWGESWIGSLNGSDYLAASNLPLAANLRGKLLLMHGEMDDNVSPTLTLKLVDALIQANKDFDLLLIPNGDHNVPWQSPYCIRRRWDYFVRHLLGTEPPVNYAIAKPQ